jgi:hypothetical protein
MYPSVKNTPKGHFFKLLLVLLPIMHTLRRGSAAKVTSPERLTEAGEKFME